MKSHTKTYKIKIVVDGEAHVTNIKANPDTIQDRIRLLRKNPLTQSICVID